MQKKYIRFWHIEALIVLFIGIAYSVIKNTPLTRCIIYENFNIYCPTCGGTRCVINFLKLKWKQSFNYNPIIFFTIIYLIILNIVLVINYFSKKERFKWMLPNWGKFAIYACCLFTYGIVRNVI